MHALPYVWHGRASRARCSMPPRGVLAGGAAASDAEGADEWPCRRGHEQCRDDDRAERRADQLMKDRPIERMGKSLVIECHGEGK